MHPTIKKLNATIAGYADIAHRHRFNSKICADMRRDMPYCAQQLKNGKYLLVNRMHRPIGQPLNANCNYEDFADEALTREELVLDPSQLAYDRYYMEGGDDCPFGGAEYLKNYLKGLEPMLTHLPDTGVGMAATDL
jgi:hypothetical protein